MSARRTATREDAIRAAADKFAGDASLPFWNERDSRGEYMRGICEVLADTFGADDAENAKSEIWSEIHAAFELENLNRHASAYARRTVGNAIDGLDHDGLLAAVQAAYIAGLQARG